MKLFFKSLLVVLPFILTSSLIDEENEGGFKSKKLASPIELIESDWVNSILDTLTLEEKICQLFMIPAYANMNERYEKRLLKQIEDKKVGGVILMKGAPTKSVQLINTLQNRTNIPLMVAVDGEWGPSMRIDSMLEFPKAMPLGAIDNDQYIYNIGAQIAKQCKRMGIHINFAPVIDINTTFNNPIINMRSFGSNPKNVARKGLAYAIGMQSNGVMAVGKHFPGHGSTHSDSHKTLPVVYHSKEQLLNVEMLPFEKLIHNELGGVMVAHISYPALDARLNRPASLSKVIIDSLLKTQLQFKGLVFTDALNMKGVTKFYEQGEIEVEALKAGNDVLLYPENIDAAITKILSAIEDGILTQQMITEKCRKVLKAKQWFGLDNYKPINATNILGELNSIEAKKVNYESCKKSITLIKNENNLLPFRNLNEFKLLTVNIGESAIESFDKGVNRYVKSDVITFKRLPSTSELSNLTDTLSYFTHIVIVQHGVSEWPYSRFKLKQWQIELAQRIAEKKPTVLVFTGNPYALRYYTELNFFKSIMLTYSNSELMLDLSSQAIFGGIGIKGKLPIDINGVFRVGSSYNYGPTRLEYSEPYVLGKDKKDFYRVDSLVQAAISMKATPGCQVLYARNGKVIYNRSFGHHTYGKKQKVDNYDIYDIASITKVAATTLSIMKLYENNLIDPASKFSNYFPEFQKTDKKSVRINQVLSHHSGLRSWIPFYRNTFDDEGNLRKDLYSVDSAENFSVKVADKLYLRQDYVDTVYKAILDTAIYKKKKYRYSDLGFYWLAKLVEKQTSLTLDDFVGKQYFDPLGMDFTLFNPWKHSIDYTIVPSEDDMVFRKQKIVGYVHDQGAALLGGVSGHAGLFSNANDLAKLGQLLLNEGNYGGETYFLPKTLQVFNKQYYKRKNNRRALGFDKAPLKEGDPGPTCSSASPLSMGHSGFTGTYFWVDPVDKSVFVFLSNRTYPSQENRKLAEYDFRTNIHQAFYDVFDSEDKKMKE